MTDMSAIVTAGRAAWPRLFLRAVGAWMQQHICADAESIGHRPVQPDQWPRRLRQDTMKIEARRIL